MCTSRIVRVSDGKTVQPLPLGALLKIGPVSPGFDLIAHELRARIDNNGCTTVVDEDLCEVKRSSHERDLILSLLILLLGQSVPSRNLTNV